MKRDILHRPPNPTLVVEQLRDGLIVVDWTRGAASGYPIVTIDPVPRQQSLPERPEEVVEGHNID